MNNLITSLRETTYADQQFMLILIIPELSLSLNYEFHTKLIPCRNSVPSLKKELKILFYRTTITLYSREKILKLMLTLIFIRHRSYFS